MCPEGLSENSTRIREGPGNDSLGFVVSWPDAGGEVQHGPLSVLWDLIESYQVDIFDISLYRITQDFLEYFYKAGNFNLELTSSFVVMAARLLFYKSKALLPDPGFEETDVEPRLPPELVQQLLEYRKFQLAAEKLKFVEDITGNIFFRKSGLLPSDLVGEGWLDVSLASLIQAYSDLVNRLEAQETAVKGLEVVLNEFSVEEKVEDIRSLISGVPSVTFIDLLSRLNLESRAEIIVTFLAILELVRQKEIVIRQKAVFGEIWIFACSNNIYN